MRQEDICISVIVPVYNVEKYLERCLKSIISQTYKKFEVILVDDGSTDSSGTLCDEYKQVDDRIKVLHKKNGGLSSARNIGIEYSKGEYLTFIDSDDYVAPNYLEVLMQLVEQYEAPVATVKSIKTNTSEFVSCKNGKEKLFSTSEAMFQMCINEWFGVSAWAKLYHRDVFASYRFPDGKLYEDMLTIPYVIAQSKYVASSNQELYYWYERPGSITHSIITDKNFSIFDGLFQFIKFIDDNYPELHEAAIARLIDDSMWNIMHNLVFDAEYIRKAKKVKKICNKYWRKAYKNPYLKKGKKVQAQVASISLRVYQFMYLNYRKFKKKEE